MYNTSLVVLELVPVNYVLAVWKVPEMRDVGAISAGILFDL